MEVLDGLDVRTYRPRVMIVENLLRSPEYVSRLNRSGYALWRRLFPNDIYVSSSAPAPLLRVTSLAARLRSAVGKAG